MCTTPDMKGVRASCQSANKFKMYQVWDACFSPSDGSLTSVKSLRVSLRTILPLEHLQKGAGRKQRLTKSIGLQLQCYAAGKTRTSFQGEVISARTEGSFYLVLFIAISQKNRKNYGRGGGETLLQNGKMKGGNKAVTAGKC